MDNDRGQKLLGMMQPINSTIDMRQVAFVGDKMEDCKLALYADSDFAGDRRDMKSTSGAIVVLVGPHTLFHRSRNRGLGYRLEKRKVSLR